MVGNSKLKDAGAPVIGRLASKKRLQPSKNVEEKLANEPAIGSAGC
jgi:hypothetical protein